MSIRGLVTPYAKIGEITNQSYKGIGEFIWALNDINFEVKKG